jgi:hypothetical protein
MARAHSIWILIEPSLDPDSPDEIVAAFTVKHEMIAWANARNGIENYTLLKLLDGVGRELPVDEFGL